MEQVHPLKAYRESHQPKLTQEQLADLLGVSEASISRWETGERTPAEELVPDISAKTGIPAAELRPESARIYVPPDKAQRRKARRAA